MEIIVHFYPIHKLVGDKEVSSAKGFHPYIKYALTLKLSRNFPKTNSIEKQSTLTIRQWERMITVRIVSNTNTVRTIMKYPKEMRCLPIGLTIVLVMAVLTGCNSPKVTHSLILPEANQVQAWAIALETDTSNTDKTGIEILEREYKSQYAQREYAALYVKEISRNLETHGYHLVDTAYAGATVRIRLTGQKWTDSYDWNIDEQSRTDIDQRHHRKSPESDPNPINTAMMPVVVKGDHVTSVHIEIISRVGKSLGQVDIAASGDGLKPEFIAKVVDKLIQSGTY